MPGLEEVFLFLVVTSSWLVSSSARRSELEVGRGGVEEQDVDLQVQEVGDREEDLLLQLAGPSMSRSIARKHASSESGLEPFDVDRRAHPSAPGQLRQGLHREPVRPTCEDHPLDKAGSDSALGGDAGDGVRDPDAVPAVASAR